MDGRNRDLSLVIFLTAWAIVIIAAIFLTGCADFREQRENHYCAYRCHMLKYNINDCNDICGGYSPKEHPWQGL